MELRRLGVDGPYAAVIGYGGWEAGGMAWGVNPPQERVLDAMRAAFDVGMNWIDTAEIYGNGRSEELIGRAIRHRPEIMVFTKVASLPRGSGYEPANIQKAVRGSLRRLGRDIIDLYQLHWPDETTVSMEEAWGAMAELVDGGFVRWIGVSNFPVELIERCERIRHVDSVQPQLSMLWQERLSLLDYCKENGTGVIVYGPLAYGLLAGAVTHATSFPDNDWRSGTHGLRAYEQLFAPGRFEANLDVVDALKPLAKRLEMTPAQLALAWVLHQEGVTGAIAGSRSPQHVLENAGASKVTLSRRDLEEIAAILARRGEVTVPLENG